MFNIKYDENSEYKHGYIDLDDYDSTKPTNETEYEWRLKLLNLNTVSSMLT